MIPYFQFLSFKIGPLTIQVWGLCVALGIIAAVLLSTYLARKYLLPEEPILDMSIWALISAFLFARAFHVLFYNFDFYYQFPSEILAFWHGGLSSLGGFFGAFLAVYVFAKVRGFKLKELWAYFDIMSVGLWLGWGIGRIGCFLIHDHPGTLSHFILSVKYPGGARYDLGLYESILGFFLFGVFMLLFKRLVKKSWGLVTQFSFLVYAVARFFLDFLRANDLPNSDVRYAHLTPAQWGMIAVVIGLTAMLISGKVKRLKDKKKTGEIA